MANFKIASTLLCVFLIGRETFAVINKSGVQVTANKNASEVKDEVVAEDRLISDVYDAPPSTDYGPPIGGGFSGPAPVYGPPELTGHQGPVQVYPPPPPDLPPPPPSSYGPPRKPKPHYGPPKSFGPPPPNFGPKPNFGPPKLHFGPPPSGFGSSRPQFGPPPNRGQGHRFGGPKPGHGPPIPISVEHYGPPNRGPAVPFDSAPQKDILPPPSIQHGPNLPPADLYGPPPPAPPLGVPAPPTPPDIKYDGWQPIAGLVGTPNNQQPHNSYGPPDHSFEHQSRGGSTISHGSSDSSITHSSGSHSSTLLIETPKHPVPSNSYGEPILNQDAQHLQNAVQATNSHGLPPPPLPESEPLHNHQGAAKSIPGYEEQQKGGSNIFDHSGGDIKASNFGLTANGGHDGSHGLAHQAEATIGTSISSSNSFHGDVGSALSLPTLETYGPPVIEHNSQVHSSSGDLTQQQLPLHGSSLDFSFSGNSFGGPNHGTPELSLPLPPVDSYGVPPASSFSPNGRYPAPQSPRASWQGNSNHFSSSSFNKHYSGNFHHYHRHRGPSRFGPTSITNNLVPPKTRAPIKFREQVPLNLLTNINRYLPPKPSINYGAPVEQQLPSRVAPHSFKSSASSSTFSSGFDSGSSLPSTSPVVAPNVYYGTPLSFNDFNTPAPVLMYGAPNFGPATSFVSTSFGNFGSQGNLYNSVAGNGLTTTYGIPISGSISSGHNCGFQNSAAQLTSQYNFGEDAGRTNSAQHQSFSHAGQPSGSADHQGSIETSFASYQPPLINELELESHEKHSGELKDSYGNPINFGGESDQTGAALTANDIRANSLPGYSHEEIGQQSLGHDQNYAPGATFSETSSAAVTAALTAQGYGQGKNYASNELGQEANRYQDIHQDGNEALAVALKAEGADGFQIQGSKGTYTLQIQSADGSFGTENSDGSIRHDQVLSNGLLQDILAAIEQPNEGVVQIQGAPQPQQLQEVYDNGHLNEQQQLTDLTGSHNEVVQQVLASQLKPLTDDQVALFYDNNGYEESRKNIRSTSKNEAQADLNEDSVSKSNNEAKTKEQSS